MLTYISRGNVHAFSYTVVILRPFRYIILTMYILCMQHTFPMKFNNIEIHQIWIQKQKLYTVITLCYVWVTWLQII
jgi:hypothetical protein